MRPAAGRTPTSGRAGRAGTRLPKTTSWTSGTSRMANLAFHGWRRSGIYKAVSGPALTPEGRLTGTLTLMLTNTEAPADKASGSVSFDVMGPGDVKALSAGAVIRVAPPPGTTNAETGKCPFVEFSAADLPWRYTPRLANGLSLQPWL